MSHQAHVATTTTPLVPLGRKLQTRAQHLGRRAHYALRVSLLEQCQLDCGYCRPGAVTPASVRRSWLTVDEHRRLAPLFIARGVNKVRFTGGEPLLRTDVADVVRTWRDALPTGDVALTTNGQLLFEKLDALVDAGLSKLNVHIDSLDPETGRRLMGGADVTRAFEGAKAARSRGLVVKLNVVAQRGLNDLEFSEFIDESRASGIEVRFIEMMDTGSAPDHIRARFMSARDILRRLESRRRITPVARREREDPSALYRTDDDVTFGIIASETLPFCDDCNRVRMSAAGDIRGCLYAPPASSLGALLRAGADDAAIERHLDAALDDERSWHANYAVARPRFSMSDIGG